MADLIVGALVAIILVLVVRNLIKKGQEQKKNGGCSCSCGCSHCSGCDK